MQRACLLPTFRAQHRPCNFSVSHGRGTRREAQSTRAGAGNRRALARRPTYPSHLPRRSSWTRRKRRSVSCRRLTLSVAPGAASGGDQSLPGPSTAQLAAATCSAGMAITSTCSVTCRGRPCALLHHIVGRADRSTASASMASMSSLSLARVDRASGGDLGHPSNTAGMLRAAGAARRHAARRAAPRSFGRDSRSHENGTRVSRGGGRVLCGG